MNCYYKNDIDQIEHIRARAHWYIGRTGDGTYPHDGIYTLLQEVLNHFVDEFREGYGNKIEVRIDSGQTVTVRDYGRGMSFEDRYANSRLSTKAVEVTHFGLDTVKALTSYMDIEIYKNGDVDWLGYEEGMLIHETTYKKKCPEGLSVTFALHEWVFDTYRFNEDFVFSMLRNIAYQNVGLDIVFNGTHIKSKNGMAELLADKKRCKGYYLYPIVHFKNEWIEVALTHSWANDETFYSFVNGVNLYRGGTHVNAIKKAVASILIRKYSTEGFVPEDVYAGMVGAIMVNVERPIVGENNWWMLFSTYFDRDEKVPIKEHVQEFFCEKFKIYLLEHQNVCRIIHDRMCMARDKRKLCKKCMAMSVEELVNLWNDSVELGTLELDVFYAIRDALFAKEVQTIEMQKTDAIGKRLKISYDSKNKTIHCSELLLCINND